MDLEVLDYRRLTISERRVEIPYGDKDKLVIDFNIGKTDIRIPIEDEAIPKFLALQDYLSLSKKETLIYLINFYYQTEYSHVMEARRNILKTIYKGVDIRYITQIKLLYTALGHFLKRARYL
ncbi:hypothetical protein H6G33_09435 [Calothrix sp. FACHB-1219]|uniref:hypothetical protein n=1 Tax=unclassified Calothrix TaxID=2619626 RepID=UPI001684E0F0|nr:MULTISPECIES: hypothetical protein [unclassified Calothrix]MBD2201568.1 hypothetical protein [Calothrix sp. FACHB-168]MBD2217254.1 hypothetical protein [Calothrix sp. FACHB-1219]